MIQQRETRWRVVLYAGLDPVTGKRQQLAGTAKTGRCQKRPRPGCRSSSEG